MRIFPAVYISLVLLIMYLPIAVVVVYSFNDGKLSSMWEGFTLDWYAEVFSDKSMLEALKNSLFLAVASSLCAAVLGTLGAAGASAMAKAKSGRNERNSHNGHNGRARQGFFVRQISPKIEALSVLPVMLPEIILGMVFFAFFALMGLPFGMTTLIIAHTAFCVPYVYLMVKARLAGMDQRYTQAALDLGASEMRAFADVTVPQILPAILSGMMLSFAMSFDDVIISAFVTGVNVNTLPVKIYSQLKTGVTPKTNALCALLFAVTIVMALISARLASPKRVKRKAAASEPIAGE
jgi:spermidine/putrescine transport system permease protein